MRLSFRILSLIAVATVSSMSLSAQSVKDILAKHATALGSGISALESATITQKVQDGNLSGEQVTMIIPNEFFYQERFPYGGQLQTCASKARGWYIDSYKSDVHNRLSARENAAYLATADIVGPLYRFHANRAKSAVASVSLAGSASVDGEDCFKLNVAYKNGSRATVCVSKDSYLIKQLESKKCGRVVYKDYREVSGVQFPFVTEVNTAKGKAVAETESVKVNDPINVLEYTTYP